MMTLVIDVNGERVDIITITNRTPGRSDATYQVDCKHTRFTINHNRELGAHALAEKALAQHRRRVPTTTPTTTKEGSPA